jgi:hypothetical protein
MEKWFYIKNGEVFGPIGRREFKILLKERFLQPDDHVKKDGMKKWVRAKRLVKVKKKKTNKTHNFAVESIPLENISAIIENQDLGKDTPSPKNNNPSAIPKQESTQALANSILNSNMTESPIAKYNDIKPSQKFSFSNNKILLCLLVLMFLFFIPNLFSPPLNLIKTSSVQGEVYFKGKIVPVGTIYFVHEKGMGSSKIDESGKYQILNVPVGSCRIMLQMPTDKNITSGNKHSSDELLFMSQTKKEIPIPIKSIKIPDKYFDVRTSGLQYLVNDDANQTFQIQLDN